KAGGPGFGLFDFSILGLIYATVGSTFIIAVGYRLLPNYSPLASLLDGRPHSTYVTEMVVDAESKIAGKAAGDVFDKIALNNRPQPPQPIRRHRRLRTQRPANDELAQSSTVTLLEIIRSGRSHQA